MQTSPEGREIEDVEGSPSGIISRGEAITRLGEQMRRAAEVLDGIKNNSLDSGGQVGKAIDELSDKIDDSYETLYEAADLYEPVGPVITTYGEELEAVQPLINTAAGDCEDLWAAYEALPGNVEPRGTGGFGEPDADSPEAEAQAGEDRAKKAAYDAWEERARDFDAHVNTWEDAFDTAVSGITDGMSDGIEDGFWDNIGPVVDFLKNVVDIAALVVGVIALFAGGWIVALAAVLALAALALTFAQYKRGAASGWDLAFAALGVVPFGKITSLTKLGGLVRISRNGDEMVRAGKNYGGTLIKGLTDLGEFKKPLSALDGPLSKRLGFNSFGDTMLDYQKTIGRNFSMDDMENIAGFAKAGQYANNMGTVLGHYGRLQTYTNHDWNPMHDLPSVPGGVGVFL